MKRSDPNCPPEFRQEPQRRSVVLIDELDKAPRDFPNDILNEIERLMFHVKELPPNRATFRADPAYRPILILTSNLEKDLPEAFRRRCVFYHIEFEVDRILLYIERGVLSEIQANRPLREYRRNPTLDDVNLVVLECNKCGEEIQFFSDTYHGSFLMR